MSLIYCNVPAESAQLYFPASESNKKSTLHSAKNFNAATTDTVLHGTLVRLLLRSDPVTIQRPNRAKTFHLYGALVRILLRSDPVTIQKHKCVKTISVV